MNEEKRNKYMTLSLIFFLTMLIVILPLITHSNSKRSKSSTPSNRMDYINSCYILKPKKPTYFYSGKNSLSKLSKINKLIIPANVAISKTVIDDSNSLMVILIKVILSLKEMLTKKATQISG